MNLKIGISTFFLCLTLIACQKDLSPSTSLTDSFFDLPDFFKEEQQSLSNKITSLHKKITINGKVEEQQLDSFDLKQELAAFIAADINRPTWLDQYQVDSLKDTQGVLKTLKYSAIKDNLKTKNLTITYKNGQVVEIYIKKAISTMAAESFQELTYYKGKGYTNYNEQSMAFSDANTIRLEVNFLK